MTGLNGVHALLAFLTQQAQITKPGNGTRIDVKQLEAVLHESRILNERLLKIEELLSIRRTKDLISPDADPISNSKVEGSWPAASVVRDVINSQERQQAFGFGQSEKASTLDTEPYSYRETLDHQRQLNDDIKQLVIERFIPDEFDQSFSKSGINFGAHRDGPDYFSSTEFDTSGESGRLILMSIGFSLLFLALFAVIA